jgi:HSP20 family protein
MKLVRWDPFQEFTVFNRPVDRTFGSWAPPVDVFEQNENLVIRAEIPGVSKDDLDVKIENGVLTLSGERKTGSELETATTYRRERVHGSFTRSFKLPTTVDASKIDASYRDGVLEVTVPKAEAAKPKKVEIRAA